MPRDGDRLRGAGGDGCCLHVLSRVRQWPWVRIPECGRRKKAVEGTNRTARKHFFDGGGNSRSHPSSITYCGLPPCPLTPASLFNFHPLPLHPSPFPPSISPMRPRASSSGGHSNTSRSTADDHSSPSSLQVRCVGSLSHGRPSS